jgi:hypothetical protein
MASHETGPRTSDNGFIGDLTGDTAGTHTGDHVGNSIQTPVDITGDGAIPVTGGVTTASKASAAALTLAAPGAANVGKTKKVFAASAQAHVITAASLDGGNTLTFGGAIGDNVVLYARSATAWSIESLRNVVLSTV